MNLRKKFLYSLIVLSIIFILSACTTTGTQKIKSIEIDETTVPTEAIVNEFDYTSLYIYATKSDDSKVRIQVTKNMILPMFIEKFSQIGSHTMEINFSGKTCSFTLKVVDIPKEIVLERINEDIENTSIPSEIETFLQLPTEGINGSQITWSSNHSAVTISAGNFATAHHPSYAEGDATVTLLATFTLGGESLTQEYSILVKALSESEENQLIMNQVANSVQLPTVVLGSLTLPFTSQFNEDVKFEWATSHPAIIVIDNENKTVEVSQPSVNTAVTLTLTLTYRGESITYPAKEITVSRVISVAPSVTNVALSNNNLTWQGVAGASTYKIYLGDVVKATTTSTNYNIASFIPTAPGIYYFGVQTVAFGSYNEDAVVVTVQYVVGGGYVGTYYDGFNFNLQDNALKLELRTLITTTHTKRRSYADLRTDTVYSDADIKKPGNIILFYTRVSVKGAWDEGTTWNREHVWPQSLGWFTESGAGSDLHHIRPTNPSVNTSRGNKKFGEASGYYNPTNDFKGDVARIIFYLMTRYSESDRYSFTSVVQSLDMLLLWNDLDPVDDFEIMRNNRTAEIQGNRNPFIDYPDLADQIWD